MEDKVVNELNTFLKGEFMAVDSYEKYIEDVKNSKIKDELQSIQQDHKWHAMLLSERIQDLGGKPANGVGVTGKISETMSNIKNIGKKDDLDIIDDAYNGEKMGIDLVSEMVKGDLDGESMKMVQEIIDKDKSHLNTLDSIMNSKYD